MREYTIYATDRGEGFTTYSVNYSQGTHRWIYTVYAASVRQAYWLAGNEQWAPDARSAGVRTITNGWWNTSDPRVDEKAPYLSHDMSHDTVC